MFVCFAMAVSDGYREDMEEGLEIKGGSRESPQAEMEGEENDEEIEREREREKKRGL